MKTASPPKAAFAQYSQMGGELVNIWRQLADLTLDRMKSKLLLKKPCPSCGRDHGHSSWKVANSSAIKALRCSSCDQNFHQTGLSVWLFSWLFFPSLVLTFAFTVPLVIVFEGSLLPYGLVPGFLFALMLELVFFHIYINRYKPLAIGPRHG